jgi:hypothetical protein
MADALQLPDFIKTILITGAGGTFPPLSPV